MKTSRPGYADRLPEGRTDFPAVTIVIPCYNAAQTIEKTLLSVLDSDYDRSRLEVLVVDGLSTDDTRKRVEALARKWPLVRILDNPERTQQKALNIGIRQAKGDYIIRLDAHACLSRNYISLCVKHAVESGADFVGGRILTLPREPGLVATAIAAALSSRFGVGNSRFRTDRKDGDMRPVWTDTVPYACYRRDVFDRAGFFHEEIHRSEDAEFHQRLRDRGMRALYVPEITSRYYCRSRIRDLARHAFDNGLWIVRPLRVTRRVRFHFRHFVPFLFLCGVLFLGTASIFSAPARIAASVCFAVYAGASAISAFRAAARFRRPLAAPVIFFLFPLLHLGYGAGTLAGLLESFRTRRETLRPQVISFSGLDGAGKSTLIEIAGSLVLAAGGRVRVMTLYDDLSLYALLRRIRDGLKRFLGLTVAERDASASERAIREKVPLYDPEMGVKDKTNPAAKLVYGVLRSPGGRLAAMTGDMILFSVYRFYHVTLRRRTLLLDRYLYDTAADIVMSNPGYLKAAKRMSRLVPPPDHAVFVDVEPEEAFRRKCEYPLDYLQRRRKVYLSFFDGMSKGMILENRDLDESRRRLEQVVYGKRHDRDRPSR